MKVPKPIPCTMHVDDDGAVWRVTVLAEYDRDMPRAGGAAIPARVVPDVPEPADVAVVRKLVENGRKNSEAYVAPPMALTELESVLDYIDQLRGKQ